MTTHRERLAELEQLIDDAPALSEGPVASGRAEVAAEVQVTLKRMRESGDLDDELRAEMWRVQRKMLSKLLGAPDDETQPAPPTAVAELNGVKVTITPSAGSDGAMVVLIDTTFEPQHDPYGDTEGPGLRVVINDDPAFIGVDWEPADEEEPVTVERMDGLYDLVRCNNCGKDSEVRIGGDVCPHCGFDGGLVDRQEEL